MQDLMDIQKLQETHPAWVQTQKDSEGYWIARTISKCRRCGAKHRAQAHTNYSIFLPMSQKVPAPVDPHIQRYTELGDLCLTCAESLPLEGKNAYLRDRLVRSRQMGTL